MAARLRRAASWRRLASYGLRAAGIGTLPNQLQSTVSNFIAAGEIVSCPASFGPGQQVAPGVHRLGDKVVNFYLVDQPGGLVLIDAGLPGHLSQLRRHLAEAGHSLGDIRAVLLTHAHPDHTGLASTLQEAGTQIWV